MLDSIFIKKNALLLTTLVITLVALLLPSLYLPDIRTRSLYHLWETGHVLVFFLICHFSCQLFPQFSHCNSIKKLSLFFFIAICFAFTIEWIQSFISGKSLEFSDIVGDTTGVLLFLSFRARCAGRTPSVLHGLAILLLGLVFWPVFSSFTDERLAEHQFPLLTDFETPFEASRFEGKTAYASISGEQAFQGQHSLRLSFFPGPWSGMMLKHFPSNWQRYSHLHFAVYNPTSQPVSFHVRIHDALHEQGKKPYSDLYSQIFSLSAGDWTRIMIPLAQVYAAPLERRMDLADIRGLGFFVVKEEKPLVLYLDTVGLE